MATRQVPTWFDDAKLGIFIHWTAAAVPAYAPAGPSPFDVAATEGWPAALARMPYVEWYQNSISIEGSPAALHHEEHYGDLGYEAFVAEFLEGLEGWDPQPWADLFRRIGARYVVLVTKHHDGVTLWPSDVPNPSRTDWSAVRDVVGDLGDAVRAEGLRYGLYYSGGLDWTFGGLPMHDGPSLLHATPQSPEYVAYADAHWRELIDRYQPALLWNDIGYPKAADLDALFAHYYEVVPDGVINDRFRWGAPEEEVHTDFATPEYSTAAPADGRKWEATRGLGSSFGYNRTAPDDDHISTAALVELFVDIVARGGNLLLNVGPTGDGRIPWVQLDRLLGLGAWLDTNGAAIFATRPWVDGASSSTTADGRVVHFTEGADGTVHAIVVGEGDRTDRATRTVRIAWPGPLPEPGTRVTRLGHGIALEWSADPGSGDGNAPTVTVALADPPAGDPAFALAFTRG